MATAPRVSYGVGEEQDIAVARKADEPLQRIAQEGQAAEALQQTGVRYAQEQEQKAKANVEAGKAAGEEQALGEYAAEQKRLYEKAEKETNPFPSFNPSQEDLTSYAQLGSMIMTAGLLLGNSGKVPAKAALASMTGMLNGWRQGRRDLWDKESKAFEKELSRIKAANQAIESNLKKGLELAATNRELSRQKYMNAAAIAGRNSIIETAIATGRAQDALKRTQESTKLLMEAEKRIQQAAAQNRQARDAKLQAQLQRQATIDAARIRAESKASAAGGALPKDKETRNEHRFRYSAMQTVQDVLNDLQKPEVRKLIGPYNQFTFDILLNLQEGFPALSSKLARFQSEEFKIGGKALTASEQKILGPIYNWRGLTPSALEERLKEAVRYMGKEQQYLENAYPGLKAIDYDAESTVSQKPGAKGAGTKDDPIVLD